MSSDRICPECNEREKPERLGKLGREPVRCLACARARGSNSWRKLLARTREVQGEDAARALAKAQGVPYSIAAHTGRTTSKPPEPKPEPTADVKIPAALELRDIGDLGLRGLFLTLRRYLVAIERDEISPGQLSQNIKPLYSIVADLAGGTTASHVEIVFQASEPSEK